MDKKIPKVNGTGVNQSLTDWGGKGAGGKAKSPGKEGWPVNRNADKGNEGGYRKGK
jgi:hypothetical protein